MEQLDNGVLVQGTSELPDLRYAKRLYLDVETTGFNYYHGDVICGVAVLVDDEAYYVPVRHTDEDWNIDEEAFDKWLADIISTCKEWINHNVIFDAHFCAEQGARFTGRLVDTLVLSKLHNSDRMGYGLKPLCKDWLDMPMEEVDEVKAYLEGIKSKSYADVPADILGNYAMMDVLSNKRLYEFLEDNLTEETQRVWETEINLTPVMFDIEEFGMPIDTQEIKIEQYKSLKKQVSLGADLCELLGEEINPNSPTDVYDVLINQLGLPVLQYTKEGNPSFDKEALAEYMVHPMVVMHEETKRIVELIKELRDEAHFQSLYLDPFLKLHKEGILHPSYNQCVRTGRMSCSKPNSQQLNKRAKALVKARSGMSILSADYSQIEMRIIIHYIQDRVAIGSYIEDPKTDFHQWVSDECKIQRPAGKTLNFAMAFGAGKARAIKMLSANPDIIEEVTKVINELIEQNKISEENRSKEFKVICQARSLKMYNAYHERLPGIKQTARRAANVAQMRGYIFNAYGRRRHLEGRFCFRAFPSIIQSTAADVMKDCVVKVAPRYNDWVREKGIHIFALVHDEIAFMGPTDIIEDPEVQEKLREILEDTSIKFRVPIRMDMGTSDENWGNAS